MEKFMNYAFILIFLLIAVAYWNGSIQLVSTGGSAVNRIIQTLQGRDENGEFANYPR